MASLTLKHVDRAFPNGYEAVKDLNFQIEDGEFVILTGPSGSGKSAVMRMIAGLDEVKNGEIWIGDKLVNSLPPEERGIAMIFQNYTVYPRMTVLENVELGLRLRGIDEKEIGKRTLEVMELLDLVEVRFAKVKNLSDLWKHRTALARAMILEPDVILMDEPLRNVNPKFHNQLTQELVELQERTGVTILYATKKCGRNGTIGKTKSDGVK
ncbi:hypothetical protein HMPREF9457_00778 [Dorea formicigenerans 4_6_53AFAA]|nr:hypothetical protein HMPREF9457_00778 [Dorea formicigenerans 4_6_53AFAA]